MKQSTPQPSPPYREGDDWFFTYYTLDGPKKMGPYSDKHTADQEFVKGLRIHEANGFTDGDIAIID